MQSDRRLFWRDLAERLAGELRDGLAKSIQEWTQLAEEGDTFALDTRRAEVECIGYLFGCFGAASGSDVLRDRRDRDLVRMVALAMRRVLAEGRGIELEVGEGCPEFPGLSGDWRPALLVAWGLLRTEPGERVLEGDGKSVLEFGGHVAWDPDLALRVEGAELLPQALRFEALSTEDGTP